MTHDHTQRIIDQWAGLRPDMDTSAMAAVLRVLRAARLVEIEMQRWLADFGLNRGELDVLAALLRAGPPHELTPTALSLGLLLSTSAMTNRLDGLEARGLVVRERVPDDRRAVLVRLTQEGRMTVERVLELHLPSLDVVMDPLPKRERAQLNRLLARLLAALEAPEAHAAGPTAEGAEPSAVPAIAGAGVEPDRSHE